MAYTATLLKESVHGDQRVRVFKVDADAAAGFINTGLNQVQSVALCFKSCSTNGISVYRNQNTTSVVAKGKVAFASAASSDTFEIICFGG